MVAVEEQARVIFLEALERSAGQWTAFLDEACGENTDVRSRVEKLLEAHQAMGSMTVSFRTADGTATTGDSDYVGKTGTLTFMPGETTKTITIEVKGDGTREADEWFYVDLFGLSINSLFTRSRGIGTILNDD